MQRTTVGGLSVAGDAPRSASERPHVLIVSDDPGLREFLGEGLVYGGFWTSVVASAIQALEVFRLRSFDLVLVDAALAGVDGLELVRRLRGRSPRNRPGAATTDVPLLLVAGGPDEMDPVAAAEAGADAVLAAPIELEEAAPMLHEIVVSWRRLHPDRPSADAAARGEPGCD